MIRLLSGCRLPVQLLCTCFMTRSRIYCRASARCGALTAGKEKCAWRREQSSGSTRTRASGSLVSTTVKLYPDRLLAYHNEKLIATHPRCYDRLQDIRNPDHIQDLLVYRQRARQQTLLQAFLSLGPCADLYASRLQEKRLNAPHHIQKIVALSQIYGPDKTVRALGDALTYEAYGCEYIANILEQRERQTPVPSPLHLTRRQDLLDLDLPPADLNLYEKKSPS